MTIPVQHEPAEWDGWPQERCTFCRVATRYWHTETNNPCCQACAQTHEVSEFKRNRAPAQGAAGQDGAA